MDLTVKSYAFDRNSHKIQTLTVEKIFQFEYHISMNGGKLMEKIKSRKYNIVLSAPIGDKKGVLNAHIFQDRLEGELIIMKNENYFCGTIQKNGSCEISGHIKTLSGIVDYSGTGYLDSKTVTLVLNTRNRNLIVTGEIQDKGGNDS